MSDNYLKSKMKKRQMIPQYSLFHPLPLSTFPGLERSTGGDIYIYKYQ